MSGKRTPGFWIIIVVGTVNCAMLVAGQMMSFINYDFTVAIGLQEPAAIIGGMGVAINKGFGVGDTMVYLPLLIAGLAGLWLRKPWGIVTMAAALGITAYWPVVSLFALLFARGTPGFYFTNYISYAIFLVPVAAWGVWGIWYIFTRKDILSDI